MSQRCEIDIVAYTEPGNQAGDSDAATFIQDRVGVHWAGLSVWRYRAQFISSVGIARQENVFGMRGASVTKTAAKALRL